MFERPTVIVLGAGASAQFGFPLGADLRAEFVKGIGDFRRKLEHRDSFRGLPNIRPNDTQIFVQQPYLALVSYLASQHARKRLPGEFVNSDPVQRMFAFHDDLGRQPAETIDEFIGDNPEHSFIGKLLLSQQILLKMYDGKEAPLHCRSFSEWEYEGRRNWYHALIRKLRKNAENSEALAENKLTVVTFNYDLSLEKALSTSLADSQRFHGADYRDVVNIYHVNGAPENLPENLTDIGGFLIECAQRFSLIGEDPESNLENVRERACQAVIESDRVFVMGFNFDQSNVSTLGLRDRAKRDGVFCLNFDGNVGVKKRILDMGVDETAISTGTQENRLHIDQALADGFLDQ